MYALLKLVAQFVLNRLDNVLQQLPCTSRPCGWTVPQVRKMEVKKDTVMDTVIKKPKVEKPTKGVNCALYEARSTEQQKFDTNVIKEMKENLDNKNIPLFRVVRNSVPPDAWCETKFGTLPLFSPLISATLLETTLKYTWILGTQIAQVNLIVVHVITITIQIFLTGLCYSIISTTFQMLVNLKRIFWRDSI